MESEIEDPYILITDKKVSAVALTVGKVVLNECAIPTTDDRL